MRADRSVASPGAAARHDDPRRLARGGPGTARLRRDRDGRRPAGRRGRRACRRDRVRARRGRAGLRDRELLTLDRDGSAARGAGVRRHDQRDAAVAAANGVARDLDPRRLTDGRPSASHPRGDVEPGGAAGRLDRCRSRIEGIGARRRGAPLADLNRLTGGDEVGGARIAGVGVDVEGHAARTAGILRACNRDPRHAAHGGPSAAVERRDGDRVVAAGGVERERGGRRGELARRRCLRQFGARLADGDVAASKRGGRIAGSGVLDGAVALAGRCRRDGQPRGVARCRPRTFARGGHVDRSRAAARGDRCAAREGDRAARTGWADHRARG